MENATKALEMAASVLIAMLLIGCIVYAYTKISETQRINEDAKEIEQATDFNISFEAYDRNDLYGTDIFSLANLIVSYKEKVTNEGKGYKEIIMKVHLKNPGTQYFKESDYDTAKEISDEYTRLATVIKNANKKYPGKYNNKDVAYWANYGTSTRLEKQLNQELRVYIL